MTRWLVDTNIVIYWIVEHPAFQELKRRLDRLVERSYSEEAFFVVTPLVIAESLWVLEQVLDHDRVRAAGLLEQLIRARELICQDEEVVLSALMAYRAEGLDFADAYLATLAMESRWAIITNDQELRRYAGSTSIEW